MPLAVTIGGADSRIEILVLGYENDVASHLSDANWLSCTVKLAVGRLAAKYAASFSTHDFLRLRDQLATTLTKFEGSAAFETDEEALGFRVELGKRGEATIFGTAKLVDQARVRVEFCFPSDQTFLHQALIELTTVCRAFPPKDAI